MANKVLALTEDGELSYCSAPPEMRGKGRCNHVAHQEDGESDDNFLIRVSDEVRDEEQADSSRMFQEGQLYHDFDEGIKNFNEITQSEIDDYASQIDKIAGEKVTLDNFDEVMNRLSVDQVDEIARIGFKTAPMFSLPITDENFDETIEDNKIYFANLAEYGIAGNKSAMNQIFGEVGTIPKVGGGFMEVHKSYTEGISHEEMFHDNMVARDAQISKSVATAKPGYIARLLAYGMSDMEVFKDCGGPHNGILSCKAPGGNICEACAKSVNGGEVVDRVDRIGGYISSAISAELTTMSMKKQHITTADANAKGDQADIIIDTYHAYARSPLIEAAAKEKTTAGRRQVLFEGISEAYKIAGKPVDDFLIQTVVRKMTSYKANPDGPGIIAISDPEKELADIKSVESIGNNSNIFKKAELQTSYKIFTKPQEATIKPDAMNDIMM